MAVLKLTDLIKVKSFFKALNTFRQNPSATFVDVYTKGVKTTVFKSQSLDLLRSNFSSLSKEEFKNDAFLINYLSKPKNQEEVLSELPKNQWEELSQQLDAVNKEGSEQASMEDATIPEPAPAGEPVGAMTGGDEHSPSSSASHPSTPNIPHTGLPSFSQTSRVENLPSTSSPATEKAERLSAGEGTAATSKAAGLEYADQKSPAIDKAGRLNQSSPLTSSTPSSGKPSIRTTPFKSVTPSPERINPAAFKPSSSFINTVRSIGSTAGRFFQRNVGKYLTAGRVAAGIGAVAGGIGGGALTGGNPIGIAGGAIGGGATPSWFKSGGGGRFFNRLGNGTVNAFSRISNHAGGIGLPGGGGLKKGFGRKRIILLFLGIFLGFGLVAGLLGGSPTTTPEGTTTASDISSCKFTRAGNPQNIASSVLAGWISNAAATAGISPQVLASVAMHESQDLMANATNNHDAIKSNNYCNYGQTLCINKENTAPLHNDACSPSEIADGAKTARAVGLMQNIDIYNQGKGDLCSITNSLAIAAAKLKADGVTLQPTQAQVSTAISRYYNSCAYGSFSYCNEVWKDVQDCQVQSGSGVHPNAPNVDPSQLRQAIFEKFAITMNYFDDNHLKWAWEKLNEVSNTKFPGLVRGSVINARSGSEQVGCPGSSIAVYLEQYPETLFKYGLIHELGHVIKNCQPDSVNFSTQFSNAYAVEKGVTYYANHAFDCTGSIDKDEDYAEMIARYLSPGTGVQLVIGNARCVAPNPEVINLSSSFPLHYNVAKLILGNF